MPDTKNLFNASADATAPAGKIRIFTGKGRTIDGSTHPQTYHYQGDHFAFNDMAELYAFMGSHSAELPAGVSDEERQRLKAEAFYIVTGELKSGGSAEKNLRAPKGVTSKTATPDNDPNFIHRRRLENVAPGCLMPFDLDQCPPSLFKRLTTGPAARLTQHSAISYTTYSHTATKPRLRFIIEANRVFAPGEKFDACLRFEFALMRSISATYEEEKSSSRLGCWQYKGKPVLFDRSVYRDVQVCYAGPANGERRLYKGEAVDVDALPQLPDGIAIDAAQAAPREPISAAEQAAFPPDEFADWLRESEHFLYETPGKIFIKTPWGDEQYSKPQDDPYDDTVCYLLQGSRGFAQARFTSFHTSDGQLLKEGLAAWKEKLGYPNLEFQHYENTVRGLSDIPVTTKRDDAAVSEAAARVVTPPRAGTQQKAFIEWDGKTHNEKDNALRAELALALGMPLREIPPKVTKKVNQKGEIIGYRPSNHADNLKWMLLKHGWSLALNQMTFEVELFDTFTQRRITHTEAKTFSALIGEASHLELPDTLIKTHFDAVAYDAGYHPIARLLHGREWDGVKRVDAVIECVPVNKEDRRLRDVVLNALFTAAIVAIDEGRVSCKVVPVLYAKDNDWFKSAFVERLFSVIPGSFAGGKSVDPRSKDSVRPAVMAWGCELGELDSMSKVESGLLKAWIPNDVDKWRTEHKAYFAEKPRQTVYIGTVNKDDFIKDESLASRFPVIPLAAAIDIERVNQLLGWEFTDKIARLTDVEQLIQFWLEVRARRAAGASHIVEGADLANLKKSNERFVAPDKYWEPILNVLNEEITPAGSFTDTTIANGAAFTSLDMARAIGLNGNFAQTIGKTLKKMVEKGILVYDRSGDARTYRKSYL